VGRFLEVGSGTRRRPKRTGLPSSPGYAATRCRDKDAAFDKLRRGKGGNKRGLRDLGIQARVGRDKPPPLFSAFRIPHSNFQIRVFYPRPIPKPIIAANCGQCPPYSDNVGIN
jgi:hypothetical protein